MVGGVVGGPKMRERGHRPGGPHSPQAQGQCPSWDLALGAQSKGSGRGATLPTPAPVPVTRSGDSPGCHAWGRGASIQWAEAG